MTLDARAAREGEEQMGKRLDMIRSDFRNNKGVFDVDARWLLERLDAAESRYAQLSALVDTWQRRFNLELQRALDAESELAETREALERLTAENESMWEHVQHEHLPTICRGCGDKWPCPTVQARAFLARLPTEEE